MCRFLKAKTKHLLTHENNEMARAKEAQAEVEQLEGGVLDGGVSCG
jgi:hypothetical protein